MVNLSKFLEDPTFIEWAINPDEENNSKWDIYLKEHPNEQQTIIELKQTLSFLISDDFAVSSINRSEVLMELLTRINNYNQQLKQKQNRRSILKLAVAICLIFGVGTYLYFLKTTTVNYSNYVASEQQMLDQKTTQLLLSEEEKITIEDNNSIISYNNPGEIKIEEGDRSYEVKENKSQMNTLIVPYGKRSKIKLPDGTWVYVNSGSQLIYPTIFSESQREVYLDGEAFFEVVKNGNIPFKVKTPEKNYYIQVLGTKFNVSAYNVDHRIETVLTEGAVNLVYDAGLINRKEKQLSPGELAAWNTATHEMKVEQVKTENYTMWTQGLLLFENLELNRIIIKLERYYNIKIDLKDPLKGYVCIGGKLDLNNDLEIVLENLAVTASLNLKKINEKYFLIVD